MPRRGSNRRRNQKKTKTKTRNRQLGGFEFTFDDEQLQRQYVDDWNYYNNSIGGVYGLPKPTRVNYIMADGLVNGNVGKQLERIDSVYSRTNDLEYNKAAKHKYGLFNDYQKEASKQTGLGKYAKVMNSLLDKLEEASGARPENTTHVNYNVVWYAMNP